jgi:hypothetical protein
MAVLKNFPTIRPSLLLDFARTRSLDPRVTFTRASAGTFVDNGGVIRTAASGVPRFDHTGTGESLGLLIQPAATNDHWYSNTFSNTNPGGPNPRWETFGAVTLQEQQYPDPAGGNTATRIIPTAVSSTHNIARYSTYNPGTYAHSFFIKPQGYSRINVRCNYQFPGTTINLNTATSSGDSSVVYTDKIEQLANGWFRVTCIWNNAGGGGAQISMPEIYILDDSGNFTFTGDGVKGIDIYGFQREAGTTATSYIATGGGQATRAADVATLSNANSSIFPTSAFTVVNSPFGTAGGGSTVKLVGPTVKRTAIYASDLPQAQINALTNTGDFWRWRVLGSSFALPGFSTNGSVTVDWGDGVVETLTTAAHTFTNGGGYHDIGFRLNSGTFFKPNINNNATYAPRVIAVGPAPASMKVDGFYSFSGCTNLKGFDGYVDYSAGTSIIYSCYNCSNLASFPLVNTSSITNFSFTWGNCSSLTSFPLINTSSGTNFDSAWAGCLGLTSFPLINTNAATYLVNTWNGCSGLTSFPLINTALVYNFNGAWNSCSNLTSFPLINTVSATTLNNTWRTCNKLTSFPAISTGSVTDFTQAWGNCSSLTSFPLINTSSATTFFQAWVFCSSLATFPANVFNTTGTLVANAFSGTFYGCALTAQSIENILTSLVTNGQSNITLELNSGTNAGASTWTTAANTAYATLTTARGWTIYRNP